MRTSDEPSCHGIYSCWQAPARPRRGVKPHTNGRANRVATPSRADAAIIQRPPQAEGQGADQSAGCPFRLRNGFILQTGVWERIIFPIMPFTLPRGFRAQLIAGLVVLPVLLAFGSCGCLNQKKTTAGGTTTSAAGRPPAQADPGEVIDITNPRVILITEFGNNLIAADKKWVGKRLREIGSFAAVHKDTEGKRKGQYYATFYGVAMIVYIDPAHEDEFAKLRGGQIKFEATLTEFVQDVPDVPYGIQLIFDNARLLEVK